MKKKLVVGLGNPGAEFEATYHNVGMLAVTRLGNMLMEGGTSPTWKAHKGLFRYAEAGGITLILPLTFMNASGAAVKEAMKKFGAKKEDIVVIHDESDLSLGTYKMSTGKNAAGHKGVESVMRSLGGTNEFLRARVGIRDANEKKRKKALTFVLKKITANDEKTLDGVFGSIAAGILALV